MDNPGHYDEYPELTRADEERERNRKAKEPDMTTDTDAVKLLQKIPVTRDENGYWSHPDLIHFWQVTMDGTEHCTKEQWADLERRAGIQTQIVYLETEPLEHPAYVSYFDNGNGDISEWDQSPPPGWWLIDICDNEDGPFAVWATHADETT